MHNKKIKGITVCNPVDNDKEYLLFTVDYAAKMGFNHMQIVGPIHDVVKGNIDGMTPYRKYNQFDITKNMDYVKYSIDAVNEACRRAKSYGIKVYQWHHELDLPTGFKEEYPEIVNNYGDVEVTHPRVKDFLEHKILDFFYTYPDMDGIILTLHETKIPLLKLKDQKLGKVERVKYVTQVLFDTCQKLGKELIVRPFASIEEDYVMMAKAYEEISTELLVMDKWTQFDWSLTMPHNAFYKKIEKNPLLVEADIFGEFFGKGHLPLMLKEHIAEKYNYCEEFMPQGYVARIDRSGRDSFDDVNEVNIIIMNAYLMGKNVEAEIDRFFHERYGAVAEEVKSVMESTENVLKKTIYTKGYYYSELSRFPTLNHSKNHFYFEMLRENYDIASEEWFIPQNWKRGSLEELHAEKQAAVLEADKLYERIVALEGKMDEAEYHKLWVKFMNLKLVTRIWERLFVTYRDYIEYFETFDDTYATNLEKDIETLRALKVLGVETLGEAFYCLNCGSPSPNNPKGLFDYIEDFCNCISESFQAEKKATINLKTEETLTDYIVCGGAMEGHRLQKEVNFSDTLVLDGALCRIPGNKRGMKWSSINAHGWFSYQVKVKPLEENEIHVIIGSIGEMLEARVTIGEKEYEIRENACDRKDLMFYYTPDEGCSFVRIRFDKISGYTPCVFEIKVS